MEGQEGTALRGSAVRWRAAVLGSNPAGSQSVNPGGCWTARARAKVSPGCQPPAPLVLQNVAIVPGMWKQKMPCWKHLLHLCPSRGSSGDATSSQANNVSRRVVELMGIPRWAWGDAGAEKSRRLPASSGKGRGAGERGLVLCSASAMPYGEEQALAGSGLPVLLLFVCVFECKNEGCWSESGCSVSLRVGNSSPWGSPDPHVSSGHAGSQRRCVPAARLYIRSGGAWDARCHCRGWTEAHNLNLGS